MMAHKILALFLILSNCIVFSCCTCETLNLTLYCSEINLNKETQLNKEFNSSDAILPQLNALRIHLSNISEIYENTFEGFQHLQHVTLTNSSLRDIEPNTFLDWNNLTHLNLSYNELTSLDFHLPPNILHLNISHNNISHIKLLQNYNNLVEIDLSYNSIISIEKFGPYNALRYLDLSHNNLLSLKNITWKNEQELDSLIVSHNDLEYNPEITGTIFVKHLDLSYNNISNFDYRNVTESINLSHNMFTDIRNFSKEINKIDLSYNGITHIYEHTFKNLKKLEFLNLYFNYIEMIYVGAFHDLINLKYLDLSDNILFYLPMGLFYHLENLRTLYIAINHFEQFEHGTFTGLNKLQVLNVSNNRIDNLDAIYSLKQLRELNIANNYLYEFDVEQIKKHLPFLYKIDINGYGIVCDELMAYLLEFKVNNITVEKGDFKHQENVNGIYCHSDPDFKTNKQDTNDIRMGYIADYLSRISVALIVILVVLVFVIILISFTLYRVYTKHRHQTEIDRNLHTCSLKLLSENDPLN